MWRKLISQYPGVVVFDEFGERRFVQFGEYVRQFFRVFEPRRKDSSIMLAQRSHQRVAMLPANLAVLIAMAVLEAWLIHWVPPSVVHSDADLSRFRERGRIVDLPL
jgi:hypothetical protein